MPLCAIFTRTSCYGYKSKIVMPLMRPFPPSGPLLLRKKRLRASAQS